MKKAQNFLVLVGALLIFMFGPLTEIYANSFDNDPNYVKFDQNETYSYYYDKSSIKCTRYDPPYYAMNVTIVAWGYEQNEYMIRDEIFLYDFNTKRVINSVVRSALYSSDGSFLTESTDRDSYEIYPNTNGAFMANLIFISYFGSSFY